MGKADRKKRPAPDRYLNRELSWIEFNARVLEEAIDETVPLLERVKFLAILAKNLDEFAEVRVPRLIKAMKAGGDSAESDGYGPGDVLAKADARIREIEALASRTWNRLVPRLAEQGIKILEREEWTPEQRKTALEALAKAQDQIATHSVESTGPLPLLKTGQLCLVQSLPTGTMTHFHVFEKSAPRLIRVPGGKHFFVKLEDALRERLAPALVGASFSLVRLTRDTNFYLNEDNEQQLVQSIRENAHNDDEDLPVRLQHEPLAAASVVLEVARRHRLTIEDIFSWGTFANPSDLFPIAGLDIPELHDPPQPPLVPAALQKASSIFSAIASDDVLLFHPYNSFDPVVRFAEEAARDPQVKAVHATLYRTTSNSPIVAALIEAAKKGKRVHVLVEAKARFDEEANVARAKALEAAGARVSLGLRGLKTHMKAILVERADRRYAHLGTGNYNEKAAKIYGDVSLLTADQEITDELAEVFGWLEGGEKPRGKRRRVWNAPDLLRDRIEDLIDREIDHVKAGRPGRIIAKLNALGDVEIIEALYEAADAGVEVDLIVRGVCTLRPGRARLRVRRIVDRYLEHARVFFFGDGEGGKDGGKADLFLSSADWMGRNLDKRVELFFKIRGEKPMAQLREYLELQLKDDVKSRRLEPDGSGVKPGGPSKTRCQTLQYERLKG